MAAKWSDQLSMIFKQFSGGVTVKQLAERLQVTPMCVYRIISDFREKGYPIETRNNLYFDPTGKFERVNNETLAPVVCRRHSTVEPDPNSQRGKILQLLRDRGEQGVVTTDLGSQNEFIHEASIRNAIMGLREKGFRIDSKDGRYILKGMGVSLFYDQFGNPKEIRGSKVAQKRTIIKETPKENPKSYEVFLIMPDHFQKALEVLPEKIRKDLMDFSHKVQKYNEVVKFFLDANQKTDTILGGTL